MTADFASNLNMMMALNSFTNGAYKYQYPTINGQSFMDNSVFAMNMPAAFQQGVAVANALNATNYLPSGSDVFNASLSTPAWLQNVGNNFAMPKFDFTNLFTYNPFASSQTNPANPNNPAASTGVSDLVRELNERGISSTGDEEKNKKALKLAKEKEANLKAEAASIAEDLYDAMKGAGTKNDKLVAAVNRITKDNVMAVIEAWNADFADGMDGESLIESIQGEHHTGWFGHQQEDLENHIKEALYEKAKEVGLSSEGHAFRAKVNSEHSAWFTSDETVRTSFDDIISKISSKETELKEENKQKAIKGNK